VDSRVTGESEKSGKRLTRRSIEEVRAAEVIYNDTQLASPIQPHLDARKMGRSNEQAEDNAKVRCLVAQWLTVVLEPAAPIVEVQRETDPSYWGALYEFGKPAGSAGIYGVNERDSDVLAGMSLETIYEVTVIGAVKAGLDKHSLRHPERARGGTELLQRGRECRCVSELLITRVTAKVTRGEVDVAVHHCGSTIHAHQDPQRKRTKRAGPPCGRKQSSPDR
jgi:hypothetical protein